MPGYKTRLQGTSGNQWYQTSRYKWEPVVPDFKVQVGTSGTRLQGTSENQWYQTSRYKWEPVVQDFRYKWEPVVPDFRYKWEPVVQDFKVQVGTSGISGNQWYQTSRYRWYKWYQTKVPVGTSGKLGTSGTRLLILLRKVKVALRISKVQDFESSGITVPVPGSAYALVSPRS